MCSPCDSSCNAALGCFGSGPDGCNECAVLRAVNGTCVSSCPADQTAVPTAVGQSEMHCTCAGYPIVSGAGTICATCHPLCDHARGCYGPSSANCSACVRLVDAFGYLSIFGKVGRAFCSILVDAVRDLCRSELLCPIDLNVSYIDHLHAYTTGSIPHDVLSLLRRDPHWHPLYNRGNILLFTDWISVLVQRVDYTKLRHRSRMHGVNRMLLLRVDVCTASRRDVCHRQLPGKRNTCRRDHTRR